MNLLLHRCAEPGCEAWVHRDRCPLHATENQRQLEERRSQLLLEIDLRRGELREVDAALGMRRR